MFIVTVEFDILPTHERAFSKAMIDNARASLSVEPGCLQFDVCASSETPTQIFLYECYDSEQAFKLHLASAHFIAFNELTSPWVLRKTVRTYMRHHPSS
jgi:(4S)-4-hydroxy-5-phosphonooxypentane-2,3-dione isomerase